MNTKNFLNSVIVLLISNMAMAALPQGESLTQKAASARAEVVKDISYNISVNLEGEKEYSGKQTIQFTLLKNNDDLRIDFKDGTPITVTVNDSDIKNFTQDDKALWIPESHLKEGKNKIVIQYTMPYNRGGIGLHRFQDPEDGNVYLYTHFEPNDASRFMPCFDQPDMKATFTLDATAPSPWTVISTKRESKVVNARPGFKKWIFPKTWLMSTYLFELAAGPYHVWTAKQGKIPLRLFSRQTLAKYVNVDDWLRVTKQGLVYYGKYFAVPYPFEKYDQIIVPEFNAGAMENIAAVTFSERYTKRGKQTEVQRHNMASVILHEMAHQWFGNLVTMKWWNDLWLNESFATYMAAKSLAEATEFKTAWTHFFSNDKNWAYFSDQLPTTHPISTKINSVDEAFSNFDGITYGKGASVMKQLAYLIGDEDFQKGLQNYFKKYSFKNAELKEFIEALAEKSEQDLSKWSSTWLETMGLDTVRSEVMCEDGKFEKLIVSIDSATPDRPRTHAFEMAFLKLKDGQLSVTHKATFKIKEETEYKHKGVECPDVVFPNYNDYGYFKVRLDGGSLVNLKKDLARTSDPFLRMMFWQSLWQMTRDQQLVLQIYYDIFKKNILKETEFQNALRVTRTASGGSHNSKNSVFYFYPVEKRLQLKERQDLVHQVEDLYWAQAKKAPGGSDFQQLWVDNFITAAETTKGQQNLLNWLDGKVVFKDLSQDPDRRWAAILKLCTLGHPRSLKIMEAERKRDKSDRAKVNALVCQASQPDGEVKKAWWDKVVDPKSELSLTDKRAIMQGFFFGPQKTFLAKDFTEKYFKLLEDSKDYSEEFLDEFTFSMAPDNCTRERTVQMKEFILDHKKISPVIFKNLTELIAENERCEKIRTLASGPNTPDRP